jgi:hypothetical protein
MVSEDRRRLKAIVDGYGEAVHVWVTVRKSVWRQIGER